jgi:hypothetical protein
MIMRAGCAAARGDFICSFLVRSLSAAGFYLSHGIPNDHACGVCGSSWGFHKEKFSIAIHLEQTKMVF